jgi:c-di-GMP-binding flagellar brake protein YcgR
MVDGYWDASKEKRNLQRFKRELPVDCSITERPGDIYKTFSKDISGQGICLRMPEMVPKESALDIIIKINDNSTIKITGEVAWVKEAEASANEPERMFNVGVRFLRIDARDQKVLDNFLAESAR